MEDYKSAEYRYRLITELDMVAHILMVYFGDNVARNVKGARYAASRYEAKALIDFLSTVTPNRNADFLDKFTEFRLFDDDETRLSDWFLSAEYPDQIGFVRCMLNLKVWKYSHIGWKTFILKYWFDNLTKFSYPRIYADVDNFLMPVNDSYLGYSDVTEKVLDSLLIAGIDEVPYVIYLNTDNEVVIVIRPQVASVKHSEFEFQKLLDDMFEFETTVSFGSPSSYNDGSQLITVTCYPEMDQYETAYYYFCGLIMDPQD